MNRRREHWGFWTITASKIEGKSLEKDWLLFQLDNDSCYFQGFINVSQSLGPLSTPQSTHGQLVCTCLYYYYFLFFNLARWTTMMSCMTMRSLKHSALKTALKCIMVALSRKQGDLKYIGGQLDDFDVTRTNYLAYGWLKQWERWVIRPSWSKFYSIVPRKSLKEWSRKLYRENLVIDLIGHLQRSHASQVNIRRSVDEPHTIEYIEKNPAIEDGGGATIKWGFGVVAKRGSGATIERGSGATTKGKYAYWCNVEEVATKGYVRDVALQQR